MALDNKLVKIITSNMLPLTFVENEEFKEFMEEAIPSYKFPCRTTLSRTLLPNRVNIKFILMEYNFIRDVIFFLIFKKQKKSAKSSFALFF